MATDGVLKRLENRWTRREQRDVDEATQRLLDSPPVEVVASSRIFVALPAEDLWTALEDPEIQQRLDPNVLRYEAVEGTPPKGVGARRRVDVRTTTGEVRTVVFETTAYEPPVTRTSRAVDEPQHRGTTTRFTPVPGGTRLEIERRQLVPRDLADRMVTVLEERLDATTARIAAVLGRE